MTIDLAFYDIDKMAEDGGELIIRHPAFNAPFTHCLEDVAGFNEAYEKNKNLEGDDKINLDTFYFENDIKLTILGSDSKVYSDAHRAEMRLQSKDDDYDGLLGLMRIQASVIKSWENVTFEGKEIECNFDNALMIIKNCKWIAEQVKVFCEDRANFFLLPTKK